MSAALPEAAHHRCATRGHRAAPGRSRAERAAPPGLQRWAQCPLLVEAPTASATSIIQLCLLGESGRPSMPAFCQALAAYRCLLFARHGPSSARPSVSGGTLAWTCQGWHCEFQAAGAFPAALLVMSQACQVLFALSPERNVGVPQRPAGKLKSASGSVASMHGDAEKQRQLEEVQTVGGERNRGAFGKSGSGSTAVRGPASARQSGCGSGRRRSLLPAAAELLGQVVAAAPGKVGVLGVAVVGAGLA